MKITLEWLKQKNACVEAITAFEEQYPVGEVDYQELLDALAKDNKPDWASWLLEAAGPLNTVLKIDGELKIEGNLFFAGKIEVSKNISVKCCIKAGEGIKAGWGIKAGGGIVAGVAIVAGEGIKAGWGIKAGGGIKVGGSIVAGWDYGIYAGLLTKISLKTKFAIVISKTKPKNLLLGEWRGLNDVP